MTDVADATVARPQIRVEGAVKSFSGRVVVDIDELLLGDQAIEGLVRFEQNEAKMIVLSDDDMPLSVARRLIRAGVAEVGERIGNPVRLEAVDDRHRAALAQRGERRVGGCHVEQW